MAKSAVNSYGKRRQIHLYYHPRKTKSRGVVHEYSLATCYFEDGKNQKKIIQSLGELTDEQAAQYRLLLKVINGKIDASGLTDLQSVIFQNQKHYLDCLVMDSLWKLFKLDKIFDSSTNSGQRISTEQVAKILTINKLLSPTSKIKTIPWFQSTMLAKIMNIDEDAYERNKIFRELGNIHRHKDKLEEAFWGYSQRSQEKYDAYYFDGSSSWFEGGHCPLAEADIDKTRGFFPKVLGIMLITDNRGFPVAWEVVNGHTKDTTALKNFVKRISEKFKIREITYCFDRGVASIDNFDLIGQAGSKFVSAIRDNQIKEVLDLNKFKIVRVKIADHIYNYQADNNAPNEESEPQRKIQGIHGFLSFDNNIFFKDLGIINHQRYVASFNFELFIKETEDRTKRIEQALLHINEKNHDLASAKKDRDFNSTERDLLEIFAKHHVRDYFEYKLLPILAGTAQSFKIECNINKEKIADASLTDGLLIYISDHIEKNQRGDFQISARDIVAHYKGKYVVENAFREFKSFLELRPFFVWTEEHVKAHYDICVIACFINNYIATKMREIEVSLRDFHQHLASEADTAQLAAPHGMTIYKLKTLSEKLKRCLDHLGIADAYSPTLHRRHGVFQ